MKKFASVIALLAMQALSTLSAYSTGSTLYAQDCNVEISTMHTSHIIFATDLTYVDKTLYAKSRYGTLIVPAGETVKVVYSFNKVTLAKDQVLRVYLYEQNGSRNLCMTLNHNDLNNARTAK